MTYLNTLLLLLLAVVSTASAQVVTTVVSESPLMTVTQDEDDPDQQANYFNVLERNQVTTDVEFLDTDLMGDTVDPYSGGLSLRVTDIALPGNSVIPVQLSRTISNNGQLGGPLSDWTLDIPRLEGRYGIRGRNDFVDGPDCAKDVPGPIDVRGTTFKTRDYHHGLHLYDGNGGSELVITPSTEQPYALPSGYNRQTKNHWVLKCSGSDYIARSPDGLTYTFSVESRRFSAPATQGLGIILITQTVAKMVSRIEDRFGHSVDFSYTAIDLPYGTSTYSSHRLSTITANDGRSITLNYGEGDSGKLTSAVASGATWLYSYTASDRLSTVKLPDGRQWQYSLNGFKGFMLDGDEAFETSYPTLSLSVTHPYGASATYALKSQWQYKPGYINPHILAGNTTPKEKQSRNRVLVVTSKTLTIPGNDSLTWSYSYSDSGHSVDLYDYPNNGWLTRSTIDKQVNTITGPYNKVVNTFSRWKDWQEGSLLNQKTYAVTGTTALRELANTYVQTGVFQGAGIGFDGSNQDLNRTARGPATEVITQSGNTYTKTTSGYNSYGAPTDSSATNDFNSLVRHSKHTYRHDTANGVLNLPAKTYITATALTDTEAAEATPTRETTYRNVSLNSRTILMPDYQKAFGHWQQFFSAYHTADKQIGQLKTVQYQQTLSSGGNSYQTFTDYYRGQPKTITLPNRYDKNTMTLTRLIDDNGRVTQLTDFNGNITKYGYDAVGRLQFVNPTDTAWADTLYEWSTSASNQPVRTVSRCTLNALNIACDDTATLTATTTFDGLLRPRQLATTDVANSVTVYQNSQYNAFNALSFQSFASTAATESDGTSYSYDALTRVKTQVISGAGTTTTAYLADNKIKVTDGENNLTTTTYQAFGEPTYQHATFIDAPENVDTSLTVNLFGRITAITQSGFNGTTAISQTEYRAYDSQQRLCQIERNDVGTTVMNLNAAGNVVWQAQGQTATSHTACNTTATASEKVNFSYDNHGAQRTITATGAPSVTYTLDNNGDVITLSAGTVTQTYSYNSARLLNKETLALDGKSLSLTYGYNNQGHLNSLTYPNSTVVSFAPNAFGQATKATKPNTNYATNASYYANGMVNTFTYGNGVVHKTTLNDQQLPSEIRDHKDQLNHVKLGYTYDNENNVKSIIDGVDSNFSLTALNYDGLGRLTSTTGGSGIGDSSISYDGLGNIRSYSTLSSHKNHNLSYQYDATNYRLTGVTGTGAAGYNFSGAGSYDARGNITGNGMRDFSYNLRNQLTASSGNTYQYDGHNRRVKTTDSHGTSYSLYNQAGKLLYRETSDGGVNYIFLGSKLIAKEGMMPVKTDSTSNSRMHYKPFGDSIETAKDDVGYTGHKFDTDLGLSYMQARYMDPALGRFMSNDPVGYIAANPVMSFNRYLYVNNNPYKYVDPDGEILTVAVGGIVGFVGSVTYQYLTTGEVDLGEAVLTGALGAVAGAGGALFVGGSITSVSTYTAVNATAVADTVIGGVALGLESGGIMAIYSGDMPSGANFWDNYFGPENNSDTDGESNAGEKGDGDTGTYIQRPTRHGDNIYPIGNGNSEDERYQRQNFPQHKAP